MEGTWTMFHRRCSSSHDLQVPGNSGSGQRRKGRSSSPASHSNAKPTDGRGTKSSLGSGKKQESSRDKNEIPCRFKFCKKSVMWILAPSVCLNYKSEKGCTHGDKYHFRHVDGKPNEKSKKGGAKGSVAILKEFLQLGCAYQDSFPRKFIQREPGMFGSKHAVKFSKGTWH